MRWPAVLLVVLLACKGDATHPASPPPVPVPAKPSIPGIELPEVSPAGYLPADGITPAVTVSTTALSLGGTPLLALHDAAVAAEDKEGGELGLKIPRLSAALGTLDHSQPLALALDRRLPFAVLHEVMFSAKQKEAGFKQFQILARAGARLVQLPITLPDRAPPAIPAAPGAPVDCDQEEELEARSALLDPDAPEPPVDPATIRLKMAVMIERDKLTVWSINGLEGTIPAPKSVIPRDDKAAATLTQVLAEIVHRRWSGKPRPPCNREIILMPDQDTPIQAFAEIAGAVRAMPDGTELFPDIRISPGVR